MPRVNAGVRGMREGLPAVLFGVTGSASSALAFSRARFCPPPSSGPPSGPPSSVMTDGGSGGLRARWTGLVVFSNSEASRLRFEVFGPPLRPYTADERNVLVGPMHPPCTSQHPKVSQARKEGRRGEGRQGARGRWVGLGEYQNAPLALGTAWIDSGV